MSVLSKFKKPATGGSKSSDRPVAVLQGEQAEAAQAYYKFQKESESLADLAKANKEVFVDAANKALRDASTNQGKALSSIDLLAGDTRLRYSVKNMYSAIPADKDEFLQSVFGDRAKAFFLRRLEASIKPSSLADESFCSELLARLGEEFFAQHFEVKETLKVTESFHTEFMTNPAVAERASQVPLIKQYAGTVTMP